MYGLYITHPQVRIDPDVPVPRWGLNDLGRQRAEVAAGKAWVCDITRFVSSDETKAIELADRLSRAAGIGYEILDGAHENDRSATGFLPPPEFEAAADSFFAQPEDSFRGWERAVDAQARIVAAVRGALKSHDRARPIAFIGHGGVGTLLRCHLAGLPIGRIHDQPPNGGGNLFAFRLDGLVPLTQWVPLEDWSGVSVG